MNYFFEEATLLSGKDKLNIYLLLITKLSHWQPQSIDENKLITSLINELKILFHNHEQQFTKLENLLNKKLESNSISERIKGLLKEVIECIKNPAFISYYTKTGIDSSELECRVGRYFESNIAINALENPSPKVWESINKVSDKIIAFIEKKQDKSTFEDFLKNLGPIAESSKIPNLALAFGRFDDRPSINDVIHTLNEKKNISRVMLIHFLFMRDIYFLSRVDDQAKDRVLKFGYQGDLCKKIHEAQYHSPDLRQFFADYTSYPLYSDRGRGQFNYKLSKTLGICINNEDRSQFPKYETGWYPDCLCQEADLNSKYTQSLIQHDIPYVAGPSGMTTLLSAAMILMGQFSSIEEHHYYIWAIMAFITGGGLHSIHEVLTVPQQRLGLIDFYRSKDFALGNYNDFFHLFAKDEFIMNAIDKAWVSTIQWVSQHYPVLVSINQPNQKNESMHKSSQIEEGEYPAKNTCCIVS